MSFYTALKRETYYSVVEIRPKFDDGSSGGWGTGFNVNIDGKYFVLTARHVIDPRYRPRDQGWRDTSCVGIEICFHALPGRYEGCDRPIMNAMASFNVSLCIHDEDDCDASAIRIPDNVFTDVDGNMVEPFVYLPQFVADSDYFYQCNAGESVGFIGFPDNSPVIEWQGSGGVKVQQKQPLYRQGVLAAPLIFSTRIDGAVGSDYAILDAYAQGGYSGSPVFALQRGMPPGQITFSDFRGPKIIGLICGHYRSGADRANGVHSGLSYFVRSTTLLKLLGQLRGKT